MQTLSHKNSDSQNSKPLLKLEFKLFFIFRIDIKVLSVIAHQIQTIQRAIQVLNLQYSSRTQKLHFLSKTIFQFQAKLSSLNFEDSDIKINAGCAVFVTTESLQEESKNIPDNLKVRYLYIVVY